MVWLFSTIYKAYCIVFIFKAASLRGGATQPVPRNKEAMELRRDPIVEPRIRVQTAEPKIDLYAGSEARQSRKR